MKYPHLHKKTATYLDADTEERIWHIRSPHWIGYPQAEHILNKLEDLWFIPNPPYAESSDCRRYQ